EIVAPTSASGPVILPPAIYIDSSVPACSASMRRTSRANSWTVDLVRRHQYGSAFVLHKEHDEFRRFGLAGVSPHDVNIRGTFIEGLTGRQSHFLPAPHLHHDRALQHINEPVCIVAMDGVRTARRILHGDHDTFLAGKLRQV